MNFYCELDVEELLFDNKNSCGSRRFEKLGKNFGLCS
jgi:hypothetical protein